MALDPMFKALMNSKPVTTSSTDPRHEEAIKEFHERLVQAEPERSPYIYYEDTSSTVTGSATSPILYGRCVVCGKPCNSKCSACSSNGTQWMYFCGKDHQMLVWPLHKRVCGKRSTPWSWPPLTKRELQEMIDLTTVPCREEDGGITTWAQRVESELKALSPGRSLELGESVDFPTLLARMISAKLEPTDGSPLPPIEIPGLVNHRSAAWLVSGTSGKYLDREPTFEETLDILVRQPFNFLAHFECNQIGFQDAIDGDARAYWSNLQHHLVIMLSFISLAWQRGTRSIEYIRMEAYRQHAYDETMKYCREVIKPIDPEMAQKLAWNLITPLLRNHSQMNSTSSCPTM